MTFKTTNVSGPGSIRNISLVIDPLAGTGAATGQLQVARSSATTLPIEPGTDAAAMAVIPAKVPIPIDADAFGGLRLTFLLSALSEPADTVGLVYNSSALTFSGQSQLAEGGRFDARLDATLEVNVEDLTTCKFVWPRKGWAPGQRCRAVQFPAQHGLLLLGRAELQMPAPPPPYHPDRRD